jgi:hypothetical protein
MRCAIASGCSPKFEPWDPLRQPDLFPHAPLVLVARIAGLAEHGYRVILGVLVKCPISRRISPNMSYTAQGLPARR